MTSTGASVFTASVLFTDMVGSTAMRARLGDDAADELFAEHDALLDDVLELCSGRLVKRLGDGVFATFGSAVRAFEAAATIQRRVERFAGRYPERAFALRVGIAAGDVQEINGDISGIPVVEAARLCAVAGSGEVLASDLSRALVGNRSALAFTPVGEMVLHGLPHATVVHRLDWRTAVGADDRGGTRPSLAAAVAQAWRAVQRWALQRWALHRWARTRPARHAAPTPAEHSILEW